MANTKSKHSRKKKKRITKTELDIGTRAMVRFGPTNQVAVEIVEDRGPIGVGGRRLVRVRYLPSSGDNESTFEVAMDDLVFDR
jgi:urease beta subunit